MKTEYTCQGASSEGANGENERALTQCSVFEWILGRRPTPEDVDFVLQVAPYFAQVWNEGHRGAGIIAAIIATRMNSSKRILPHHFTPLNIPSTGTPLTGPNTTPLTGVYAVEQPKQ